MAVLQRRRGDALDRIPMSDQKLFHQRLQSIDVVIVDAVASLQIGDLGAVIDVDIAIGVSGECHRFGQRSGERNDGLCHLFDIDAGRHRIARKSGPLVSLGTKGARTRTNRIAEELTELASEDLTHAEQIDGHDHWRYRQRPAARR